jgi:hypothetical protein
MWRVCSQLRPVVGGRSGESARGYASGLRKDDRGHLAIEQKIVKFDRRADRTGDNSAAQLALAYRVCMRMAALNFTECRCLSREFAEINVYWNLSYHLSFSTRPNPNVSQSLHEEYSAARRTGSI